jgi:diguanylate cyclase (GGDEF)-like protein
MKISILFISQSEKNINLFRNLFSKELYDFQSVKYDDKILLQNYEVDLIIIDNSNNDIDFESLFQNHTNDFFINIALFLYGDYEFLDSQYFKYFDDVLLPDHDEHLIRSKIFSIMKYYFRLHEAKEQGKFGKTNFDNFYRIDDCRVAFIGNDEKIFDDVKRILGKKVLSIDFIYYKDYYDDFLKIFEYDFDLVFISGVDSIHQLVYFYSEINANKNLKDAHILYIKKNTDLIFPADIINAGVDNYINYPIHEKELLAQTIVQLKNKKHFDDCDKIFKDGVNQTWKDELTGAFNKRYLNVFLENLEKSHGFRRGVGFIMIDLDDFKNINDKYGHFVGDQILKEFADILKKCVDEKSIAVRFGGDEFCIVVMSDEIENKVLKMQNIISKIGECVNSQLLTERQIKLSVSMGFTISQDGESDMDLISRADKNMYEVKFGKK